MRHLPLTKGILLLCLTKINPFEKLNLEGNDDSDDGDSDSEREVENHNFDGNWCD